MSIVTNDGRSLRAVDYVADAETVYFAIGRTTPWPNEEAPPDLSHSTMMEEIIGYKKADLVTTVIPHESGEIVYKNANWKLVKPVYEFGILAAESLSNSVVLKSLPVAVLEPGDLIRINKKDVYTIDSYSSHSLTLTFTDDLEETYPEDAIIEFGAVPAGARWVYIRGSLNYAELPLVGYRQLGVVSNLSRVPEDQIEFPGKRAVMPEDVLDYGVLDIVDNFRVVERYIDQREKLAVIIEF